MKIRIGSRGSPLARVQSATVGGLLTERFPDMETEFVFIKTSGDKIAGRVSESGGKGIFVREIEEALLDGSIDVAVHSMKDLPSVLPEGLVIGAVPKREDPSDCVALAQGDDSAVFEFPKKKAKIGTGSLRRACQILEMFPDVSVEPVKGNIETRMEKMDSGKFDALVLATAALNRLGMRNRISRKFNPMSFVPAPGQGALAVECREGDAKIADAVRTVECKQTRLCVEVERAFLHKLGGDCRTPAGCYAGKKGSKIEAVAVIASPDGSEIYREQIEGDEKDGAETGARIAEKIVSRQRK